MTRSLTICVVALFAVWLSSVAILLLFLASLAGVPALVGALVALIGVSGIGGGILLVTNTRPPAARPSDPFSQTTEELRPGVLLPDGRPYGRRERDDTAVVKRIIDKFKEEDAERAPPETTPKWALNLMGSEEAAAALFPDAPKEEERG